jgi:hypothetical protein
MAAQNRNHQRRLAGIEIGEGDFEVGGLFLRTGRVILRTFFFGFKCFQPSNLKLPGKQDSNPAGQLCQCANAQYQNIARSRKAA